MWLLFIILILPDESMYDFWAHVWKLAYDNDFFQRKGNLKKIEVVHLHYRIHKW